MYSLCYNQNIKIKQHTMRLQKERTARHMATLMPLYVYFVKILKMNMRKLYLCGQKNIL